MHPKFLPNTNPQKGGGNNYVALGGYISGNRAGRGALWFHRHCHCGSGNSEVSVLPVPGCVRDLVYRRNERSETTVKRTERSIAWSATALSGSRNFGTRQRVSSKSKGLAGPPRETLSSRNCRVRFIRSG